MHHQMRRGHLEAAARLAHHLGETEPARSLAAAYAEWKLRWLREHQPTQPPKSAANVLEPAAEVGLDLRPEQDAALRQDLHAAAARMRQRTDVLPWVEELERRFPLP